MTFVEAECTQCRRNDPEETFNCHRCMGTGNEPLIIKARLWACANCGAYYGASSAGDLANQARHDITGSEKRGSRATCPYCKYQREDVEATIYVPIREELPGV